MSDQPELFELALDPAPPPRSVDARRTARQRAMVDAGVHPLTGMRTRPELGTCGDCKHRKLVTSNGNRSYPKCELVTITHGAATDCRRWWPACPRHEPKEPS